MLRGKQNSKRRNWKRGNAKRKGRTKALTVLGVAGALSLAGSASGEAVGPPGDVSLSTFYVFDRENAGARRSGLQLAKTTRSRRPRQGGGGRADDCAGGGPTCDGQSPSYEGT